MDVIENDLSWDDFTLSHRPEERGEPVEDERSSPKKDASTQQVPEDQASTQRVPDDAQI